MIAARLALMMFLQYGGLGAWIVPVAVWLRANPSIGGLGFADNDIGLIYSTLALGAFFAPIFTGVLADRTFASEKIIAFNNTLLALLLAGAGLWCDQHSGPNAGTGSFLTLFLILLTYGLLIMIGFTTGTAMTMRNLQDGSQNFGRIRLFGTFGWVVTVAIVGLCINPVGPGPFYLGAICHLVLGTGSFWLPHTPPLGKGRPIAEVVGLPALKLFRDPSFVVFVIVAFTANMMQPFYSIYANVCCHDLGLWKPEFVLTSSQWVEMACMASIPVMVGAIGLKATLALGIAAWVIRCAAFSSEHLTWIVLVGIPLQGLAYTYFSIVGQIYIDREAPPHLRAGAQGLMTFVSGGPGTLVGNTLAGYVVTMYTQEGSTNWTAVWLVPTLGSAAAFVVFLLLFREPRRMTPPSE